MSSIASKGPIESFLSGKLAHVDVKQIQTELRRLWQEAEASQDGQRQVTRACSGNLVLFTDRNDAEVADANLLDEVVLQHPSRAMLVISRSGEAKHLDAWVSARCHLWPGSTTKQICSELITILAEQAEDNQLLSVMESLTVSDLPLVLWWIVPDLSGEKIGPYLTITNHLIVDSLSAKSNAEFSYLQDLTAIAVNTQGCICVSDINWKRLLAVRCAIADQFERLPLSTELLKRIKNIKIETVQKSTAGNPYSMQALLLTGWLASRLGWSFANFEQNKMQACFKDSERMFTVQYSAVSSPVLPLETLSAVDITLEDNSLISVRREWMAESKTLSISLIRAGEAIHKLVVDDSHSSTVSLVGEAMEESISDTIFLETLEAASLVAQSITLASC